MNRKNLVVTGVLIALLGGCTNIAAPVEEPFVYAVTEPLIEVQEILPFSLPYNPTATVHPCFVNTQINLSIVPLLYEGLYELDENFNPQPVLVSEAVTSEDGLTWTFTLKEGIYFWDGTPLTGTLVASALNEAKSEGSRYASRFEGIRSVTGNESQVTVSLHSPNYLLPTLLDIPISYGGGNVPLGTGAYRYWEGTPLLSRSENWWGTADLPNEVILVETILEGDLISAFDAGELSLLEGDLTTSQVLGYSGNYQVWQYNSTKMFYLGVEQGWGNTYRTLLSLCNDAIDRQSLVNKALLGYGVPTAYPIHPHSEMGQALPPWEYNPDAFSEKLISLASVSYPIRLIVHDGSEQKMTVASEIANQLGEFGVRVNIEALPWSDYVYALEQGDFNLYVGEIYLSPDFDVSSLLVSGGMYAYGNLYDETLYEYWHDYRLRGVGILEHHLIEIPAEDAIGMEGFEYLEELFAREPEYDEEGNIIEEIEYPTTVWVRSEEEPEQFFSYVKAQNSIIPLFFKNGMILSLWGHLETATPISSNLFYDLEQWVFRK